MQSLNKWLVSICVSVVIILVQIITTQYSIISSMRAELDFAKASSRLSSDQISDMMYELSKIRSQVENTGTQQFVAGVAAAIERRDEFTSIWHAGYDRGVEVQQYADKIAAENKTAAYTEEKK